MPLVWVEAEYLFVARGYVYRVSGNIPGHVAGEPDVEEDSETVLDHQPPDHFTVLSSRSPEHIAAAPPVGWVRIEPAHDLDVGARIGAALVARRHGGNEYTVVHPTASIEDDPTL